jgi:flagellar hook-basal body complex protein FliE
LKIDFPGNSTLKISDVFNQSSKENHVSFSEMLRNSINQVNQIQLESQNINNQFITGEIDNVHQVTLAAQKAEMALQYTIQIRNKILDAYNEIMRMPI